MSNADTAPLRALLQLGALFRAAIHVDGTSRRVEVHLVELARWRAIADWGLGNRPAPEVRPHEVIAYADIVQGATLPPTGAGLEVGFSRLADTARRVVQREATTAVLEHETHLFFEVVLAVCKMMIKNDLADIGATLHGAVEVAVHAIFIALDVADPAPPLPPRYLASRCLSPAHNDARALRELHGYFAGPIHSDGNEVHRARVTFTDLHRWHAVAAWGLGERRPPEVAPHEVVAFTTTVHNAALRMTIAGLKVGLSRIRYIRGQQAALDVSEHDACIMLRLMALVREQMDDNEVAPVFRAAVEDELRSIHNAIGVPELD